MVFKYDCVKFFDAYCTFPPYATLHVYRLLIVTDPTLNVENIKEVMEGLRVIPDLDVPCKQTKGTCGWQDLPMSREERIRQYVYSHPCPSWSHIMRQLQDRGLKEATMKVFKHIKGVVNSHVHVYMSNVLNEQP